MKKIIDPQVNELLRANDEAGIPAIHSFPYADAREFYVFASKRLAGEAPENLGISDRVIKASGHDLSLRIYRPRGFRTHVLPAVIYFHGGGWCVGNLESHDHVCRWLAAGSGCVIIAADYRLGPEHKFPAAVEDAFSVCQWVFAHAPELNIDINRIAVAGDSAGGNLTAAVTLIAREKSDPKIACQVLIYPATDMMMSMPSHAALGDGYRLTRSSIVWFINGYLRDGEDMRDFRASPLLAESHADLPPAFILTAGFDPLVDEGEAYAKKLEKAGVNVKYCCYEGMIHGFIAMPGALNVAITALQDVAEYLKQQLST